MGIVRVSFGYVSGIVRVCFLGWAGSAMRFGPMSMRMPIAAAATAAVAAAVAYAVFCVESNPCSKTIVKNVINGKSRKKNCGNRNF